MASVSPWRLPSVSGFLSKQAVPLAAPRRRRLLLYWRAHAGDKTGGGHWSRRQTRQTSTSKDHYGVLGVGSDASAADIKLAFRQLARKGDRGDDVEATGQFSMCVMVAGRDQIGAATAGVKYHPDVNKELGAPDAFKTVRHAYEILSNDATRSAYDHSLRMQRRTREMYKSYPSGYNRERKTNGRNMYRQKQKFSCKTIDNEDVWDYCSARGVTEENLDEYFKNASKNTAKKTCKYSDEKHDFGAQMKARSEYLIAEHTAWYKLACVVAWLIGGHRGLALQYGISTTGWLYGKAHDVALAVTLMGLWIAGIVTDFITLPCAMVLFMICMYVSITASH